MTLIADFLAGSILTLILPVALLIALVWWYLMFLRRVPETTVDEGGAAAHPGQGAAPAEAADLGSVTPASAPNPAPGAPGEGGSSAAGHAAGDI
jgi:hypothetical protein